MPKRNLRDEGWEMRNGAEDSMEESQTVGKAKGSTCGWKRRRAGFRASHPFGRIAKGWGNLCVADLRPEIEARAIGAAECVELPGLD